MAGYLDLLDLFKNAISGLDLDFMAITWDEHRDTRAGWRSALFLVDFPDDLRLLGHEVMH